MQQALDAFLLTAVRHPWAALAFVALTAFAESLAIIGTFVPAALVMFGAGVLAGIAVMQVPAPQASARDVLRLWKSSWELAGGVPIWYGAYAREIRIRPNYSFLRQEPQPAHAFSAGLASAGLRRVDRRPSMGEQAPQLWVCSGP